LFIFKQVRHRLPVVCRCMCRPMFIVSHATVCFCMFLVGYPQTPEPVIPLVDWHKLTTNQSIELLRFIFILVATKSFFTDFSQLAFKEISFTFRFSLDDIQLSVMSYYITMIYTVHSFQRCITCANRRLID